VSVIVLLVSLLLSVLQPVQVYFPDITTLARWVLQNRDALVKDGISGQYAVMRRGMDVTFGTSSRLYSSLNGWRILDVEGNTATVWLDVSDWFLWSGGRSAAGDVVLMRLRKVGGLWFPQELSWWIDLREYQLDRFNPSDLVSWNRHWLPYLMLTPAVRLVDASPADVRCNSGGEYDGRIAASFMLGHTYPVGSFKWGLRWQPVNYPGDDCANSVSYSLMCGGMKPDGEWRPGKAAWIYVPALWRYLIHQGWRRIPCEDADVGDVLLFDVNQSGTPEHATLITGKVRGVPLYSGHTSQKVNMPVPKGHLWMCYRHP